MSERDPDPDLRLAPVDASTWRAAYALRPRDDQAHFVAPNAYSMLEAQLTPGADALVGYAGDAAVGFAMIQVEPGDPRPWIVRFMIDAEHQGRGHGRRLLDALLDRIDAQRPGVSIRLSVVPGNSAAERLYRSAGFRPTGEVAQGERVFERPGGPRAESRPTRADGAPGRVPADG